MTKFDVKELSEDREYTFIYNNEKYSIKIPQGSFIFDCDDELFCKWLRVMHEVNLKINDFAFMEDLQDQIKNLERG